MSSQGYLVSELATAQAFFRQFSLPEETASLLFDYLDRDGNGELDYNELYVALRAGCNVELDSRLRAGAVCSRPAPARA